MRTVLLIAVTVALAPILLTCALATWSLCQSRFQSRRASRPVPGHALSTGHIRDSRGRTAFWGCCECDPALRWHDARLPLVWALHDQHLHAVRALSASRHPSRGGAS